MKSKSTAVILAILLGGPGVHHFYLNNTKKGLLYLIPWLLFFWTVFIPFILWIIEAIEGIILANKSQEDFDIEYNLNSYRNPTSYTNYTNYAQTNSNNTTSKETQKSKTEQLLDLKKLYDAEILTEEEFNKQKSIILNS